VDQQWFVASCVAGDQNDVQWQLDEQCQVVERGLIELDGVCEEKLGFKFITSFPHPPLLLLQLLLDRLSMTDCWDHFRMVILPPTNALNHITTTHNTPQHHQTKAIPQHQCWICQQCQDPSTHSILVRFGVVLTCPVSSSLATLHT